MGRKPETTYSKQKLLYIPLKAYSEKDKEHTPNHNNFKDNKIGRDKLKWGTERPLNWKC